MQSESLFENVAEKQAQHPLAYKLSPTSFDEYVGQQHLIGEGKPLRNCIEQDKIHSMILWGPPGCGKTALSRLIAKHSKAKYQSLNAVTAKVVDIRTTVEQAKITQTQGLKTILFIDEIHRLNKAQQDALLPDVESGLITFIGATTENPFFSVIPALISRSQVYELKPLEADDLEQLIIRALDTLQLKIESDAQTAIIALSQGDARKLINLIEIVAENLNDSDTISKSTIDALMHSKGTIFNTDAHYDLASAFIKSMRASDPDASIYWLARMLKGGEDPEFIARRMIIFASEDIGNADPQALILATSLLQAVKFIGLPEVQINLAQGVTYLATAPKSNASYIAIKKASAMIDQGQIYAVPDQLKDAHYGGAKKMGYGKGYQYPHDFPYGISPSGVASPIKEEIYTPKDIGYEKNIKKRLEFIRQIRRGATVLEKI
jgi:putative ATPase